jgi:tRNA/rRNA methyltransferase
MSELQPAIILVRPQLAENIGAAARAMLNCGLDDLRLVRPRCRWPHSKAVRAATGAAATVEKARVFDTIEAAIADLQHVFATCPRRRDMVKPVIDHRAAAGDLRAMVAVGERPGILFGPERTGLENEEMSLADTHVRIPLNPEFDSLNLAQAVLAVGLAWWDAGSAPASRELPLGRGTPASKGELTAFFARLEAELDACGFLRNPEMRPTMVNNLRSIFHRAGLLGHEVRTLHGVITGLTRRPHAPREDEVPPAPRAAPAPRVAKAGRPRRAARGRAD